MKRAWLSTALLLAWGGSLLAQGVVELNNNPYNFLDSIELGGPTEYKISKSPGQPVDDPTWQAQLWEKVGDTFLPLGAPLHFEGSTFPGVLNVWNDRESGLRIVHVPRCQHTTLEVRVFDGEYNYLGKSAPFSYHTDCGGTDGGPGVFFMHNFRGFVVPEPSTLLLGVVGLGGMLVFGRRRREPASSTRERRPNA